MGTSIAIMNVAIFPLVNIILNFQYVFSNLLLRIGVSLPYFFLDDTNESVFD